MADSIIIIPTYNEIENIEQMVRKIFSYEKDFHLLVVDDNSPDGTADKVQTLQTEFPNQLFLLKRPKKDGLGNAYKAGFDWCLNATYDYIFEMDADFSHNPDDLIRLYNACTQEGIHLSIGSRYCKGGKIKNWPLTRILMSYSASLYVRFILRIGIKDTTAGFKCYSRKALEAVKYHNIPFKGYAFQICMKYGVRRHNLGIKEVPITFVDRQKGTSKMSSGIFKEALLGVWKMKRIEL